MDIISWKLLGHQLILLSPPSSHDHRDIYAWYTIPSGSIKTFCGKWNVENVCDNSMRWYWFSLDNGSYSCCVDAMEFITYHLWEIKLWFFPPPSSDSSSSCGRIRLPSDKKEKIWSWLSWDLNKQFSCLKTNENAFLPFCGSCQLSIFDIIIRRKRNCLG